MGEPKPTKAQKLWMEKLKAGLPAYAHPRVLDTCLRNGWVEYRHSHSGFGIHPREQPCLSEAGRALLALTPPKETLKGKR